MPANLNAVLEEQRGETRGNDGIALAVKLNAPIDSGVSGLHRLRGHGGDASEKLLAVFADGLQRGAGDEKFVVHDVPQSPRATGPGIWKINLLLVSREAFASALKFGGFNFDGRGDSCGSNFGEHSVHVLPPAGIARATGPVSVERISENYAGLPCFFEAPAHRRAHEIVTTMD